MLKKTDDKIKVRPYVKEDKETVIDILEDALGFLMAGDYGLPKKHHRDFLAVSGIAPCEPAPAYFVAEENGKAIGYMYIKWNGLKSGPKRSLWGLLKYGIPAFLRLASEHAFGHSDMPDGICYVAELAVKEEHRNKGAGTALLEYGKDLAKKAGLKKYTLDVYKTNPNALRLYKRQGFKVTGEHRRGAIRRTLLGERNWLSMSQDI